MTFTDAVKSCLTKYAVFDGRAPRSEFWWFWVFTVLVEVAALFVGGMILTGAMVPPGDPGPTSTMYGWYVVAVPHWLSGLVHLALFLPSLAVGVRRLHDVSRSGWWLLIGFIPFGIFVLLFWFVQPSQPAPNRFGPPPLLPAP